MLAAIQKKHRSDKKTRCSTAPVLQTVQAVVRYLKGKGGPQFSPWTPEYMSIMTADVRRQYRYLMLSSGGCTPELTEYLLSTEGTMQAAARLLSRQYDEQRLRRYHQYLDYAKAQHSESSRAVSVCNSSATSDILALNTTGGQSATTTSASAQNGTGAADSCGAVGLTMLL